MPKLSQYTANSDINFSPAEVHSPLKYTTRDADPSLFERTLKKVITVYEREVKEHGPREWLHPDGVFRSTPPPHPNPVNENRRKYASLVQWCRLNGGDEDYTKTGVSFRFGLNCSRRQHKQFLNAIGLDITLEDEE